MHKFVSLNNEILPARKTFVSAISSAALYGKGVFTTLAVGNSKPFLWEKHWKRLKNNAATLGIDLSNFTKETVAAALSRLISKNGCDAGRARLTFFDESTSGVWNHGLENKTSLLIATADFREIKSALSLAASPFPVNSKSPLAGVKSCNYLEALLAFEEARRQGFDEAIRLNEKGEITSASMANIFWVKDAQIFTPALATGCLAGTVRELLIEHFTVREVRAGLEEMAAAEEIFLTSSGIGICRTSFAESRINADTTTRRLQKFLDLQKV